MRGQPLFFFRSPHKTSFAARGIAPEELAKRVYRSAQYSVPYTRQDMADSCNALELPDMDREKIKEAADRLLDGSFLPSHSDRYRKAYKPAYVVLLREEIP